MISRKYWALPTATLVACITITCVQAQSLPYNPTYLVQGQDSKIYQFSPDASPQFSVYDVTNEVSSNAVPDVLTTQLPFLAEGSNSFIPVATQGGLTVFSGECSEGAQELDLWTYGFGLSNKTWTQMHTTSEDQDLGAKFLAAGFVFPGTEAEDVDDLYIFGGMCPNSSATRSTWTTDAAYSNTLVAISPEGGSEYEVSLTGTRSPPIVEAGLTITPLLPTSFKSDNTAAQQNFVLLGGHTQNAFINMSQVALFSMPQQAWAFVGIEQPSDTAVEPRSGHTAVLSEDGSKVVVFGGWVGDITNAASPQLAVLEIGQGYGGNGSWTWTVPDVKDQYLGGANGIYGHGAVMLPGNIMMVTGGYPITGTGSSRRKRASTSTMFYDTTSTSWSNSYTNPKINAGTKAAKSGLTSHEKTGLGAGLGVGVAAVLFTVALWLFYARRKRKAKRGREQHLRDLALGTNDVFSTTEISRPGSRSVITGYRSASWGARQEERIQGDGQYYNAGYYDDGAYHSREGLPDSRMMVNVPGPNTNLKSSLRARGPPGMGIHAYNGLATQPGVSTIQEVEERSEHGSVKRPGSATNRPLSDPFKDPPTPPMTDAAAEGRKQEVQGWVDGWQEAATSMSVSRSASKANSRTYSNLSAYHSSSSGEKTSDRTNSDLSERSNISNLAVSRSGTVARVPSQRTVGYNLFSSAAAAMTRMAGRPEHSTVERTASKRSVSHGDLARMGARKRGDSIEQNGQPQLNLPAPHSREDFNVTAEYFTPPESPIKDYKNHGRKRSSSFTSHSNSLTSHSKKALGALGQGAKRILTGTSAVNVDAKVDTIESRDRSPTKDSEMPEMAEAMARNVSGNAFWMHKQGAKDWEDGEVERSGTVRRRSGRPQLEVDNDGPYHDQDDWDVETAVQQRVVQVMFTVPKERLRVVNADNLSMISRSDTNASRDSKRSIQSDEGRTDPKRMSRVVEGSEDDSTIVGSAQLATARFETEPPTSWKGKERVPDRAGSGASGATIGKAI